MPIGVRCRTRVGGGTTAPMWERRLIPFTKLTPAACEELAASAAAAVEVFERAGLRVPTAGRLRAAVSRLREVSASGTYGSDAAELAETGRAIVLASDYYLIAHLLGSGKVEKEIAIDLAMA